MKNDEEINDLENKCKRLLKLDSLIRFVGIVNKLGRLEAGGFRENIDSHILDQKTRMLYMQMVLDFNMRQEFDNELGEIQWSASRRGKVIMMTVPLKDGLLLISAEPKSQVGSLYDKAKKIFF